MDIDRWVQGVIAAEMPDLAGQLKVPDIFQPKHSAADPLAKSWKRKRSAGDTSFLELAAPPPQAAKYGRGNGLDNRTSSNSVLSSSSGRGLAESQIESSSDRYKRKPRRKTRPDRYDLKENAKKRRSNRSTAKKKPKKHDQERKGKRRRKSDVALSDKFLAKNVSKDRLTVGPTLEGPFWTLTLDRSSVQASILVFLVMQKRRHRPRGKSVSDPQGSCSQVA
jgi:hypothetical protein